MLLIITLRMMFILLSSWKGVEKNFETVPSRCQLLDHVNQHWAMSPPVHCYHLHPPSPFIYPVNQQAFRELKPSPRLTSVTKSEKHFRCVTTQILHPTQFTSAHVHTERKRMPPNIDLVSRPPLRKSHKNLGNNFSRKPTN